MFGFSGTNALLLLVSAATLLPLAALVAAPSAAELLAQADQKFAARDWPAAIELYKQALAGSENEGDASVRIEALAQLSRCHLTQSLFDPAREWLGKATAAATDKYPLGWSRYLGVKGRFEWREGRNDEAKRIFAQMYDYCRAKNLPERAIDACRMMGIVGSPDEQIEWSLKGIKEAEVAKLESELPSLWNNLGATYGELKRYPEALEALRKAREYHWRFSGEIGKLYADYQVGWALRMNGQFDDALTWLRPSLAWAERLGNDDVQAQACQDIGEIAVAQNNRSEAAKYLKRSLDHFIKAGYKDHSPEKIAEVEKRIAELDK